jgi:glycosyltransferase A (GT-A) superfamily protein (DUF2064 family)
MPVSPWIRSVEVAAAFQALETADLVIGPTEDGGYYLIGLSQPLPELFDDVAWSSPSVYPRTLASAHAMGLRMATLEPGYDLDHLDDVKRFVREEHCRGQVPAAVETIEALSHEEVPCQS